MDPKGTPTHEQVFGDKPCFLLTDHIPMPKNTLHGLKRLGAKKIALGSRMLFASQCVVLIPHARDACVERKRKAGQEWGPTPYPAHVLPGLHSLLHLRYR